jgi:phage terminase large subunit GpA-like protein
LTPYVIPFSDAVAARTHKRVVLVVGAQMGKSDSILDIIGQRMDTAPVPMIYLGPTKQFLQEQWEPRIMDLLDEAPALRAKVARGKRMTKTRKMIAGVPLRLAHGGSSSALKSDPFGLALTDEADEMLANVKGQGDPIRQVDRRGDTYADFVHAIVSTPSEGPSDVEVDSESGLEFWAEIDPQEIASTIWRIWQSGTRYHWSWPCPHCDEYFIPRFKCLHWDKPKGPDGKERKSDPALAARTAHLICPSCGTEILNDAKEDMNARGVYVAPGQHVLTDGTVVGDPPESWTISYWVSGLASPFKSWGERAAEYVEAVRSGEPGEIQSVVNGGFGELWAPGGGDIPEWRELEKLKAPYVMGDVPNQADVPSGVRVLTAGVDVQAKRLIYSIRGWGPRSESWKIHSGEVFGDTIEEETWNDLGDILTDTYGGHPIKLALIDSGFRPGRTDAVPEHRVYQFCQKHSRFCRPTKGRDTQTKPIIPSKREVGIDFRGKRVMVGIELLLLDTDYFKRFVHERLRWPIDEPGAFHLPEDASEDYLRQLVSEARVKRPGGKPTWVARSRENHFLDCEAMNAAAAYFLGVQRLREMPQTEVAENGEDVQVQPKKRKSLAELSAALNG